jgi:hypothetical protein
MYRILCLLPPSWVDIRSGIAGPYGNSMFSILRKLPKCFPEWLEHFAFLPVVSSVVLVIICLLYDILVGLN